MERKEPTFTGIHNEASVAAPTLDKRVSSSAGKKPAMAAPSVSSQSVTPGDSSKQSGQSSSVGVVAMVVGLAALCLSVYLFVVLTETQKQLSNASSRILELQQALVLTGDESTQSLASLQMNLRKQQGDLKTLSGELDASNKEIRKLWDTRNVNKKAIAANKKSSADGLSRLKGLPDALKKAKETLASQGVVLSSVKTDARQALETATLLSGSVDQQQQSLRELIDAGSQIENRLVEMSSRLKVNEEAIRSVDAFRKNTNSELWKLKQALKPAAAPVTSTSTQ